ARRRRSSLATLSISGNCFPTRRRTRAPRSGNPVCPRIRWKQDPVSGRFGFPIAGCPMTDVASPSRSIGLSDHYLVLLSGALLGYAMVGKGFAYLGLPPLFIGEIALLAGFVVLLRTGCLIAALGTLPS